MKIDSDVSLQRIEWPNPRESYQNTYYSYKYKSFANLSFILFYWNFCPKYENVPFLQGFDKHEGASSKSVVPRTLPLVENTEILADKKTAVLLANLDFQTFRYPWYCSIVRLILWFNQTMILMCITWAANILNWWTYCDLNSRDMIFSCGLIHHLLLSIEEALDQFSSDPDSKK